MYGTIDGQQLFSSKELTLEPGASCTLQDPGASGWITVQGRGRIGRAGHPDAVMIRFGADTEDEVFITHEAAGRGVEIENTGSEPLVGLRYFGPDVHENLPKIGDYRQVNLHARRHDESRRACRLLCITSFVNVSVDCVNDGVLHGK